MLRSLISLTLLLNATCLFAVDYPIHPLCINDLIESLKSEGNSRIDLDACNQEHAEKVPNIGILKDSLTVRIDEESGSWEGYRIKKNIGTDTIKTIKVNSNTEALSLLRFVNTGGTGVFSSAIWIKIKTLKTGGRTAEMILSLPFGDRCNDGHPDIITDFPEDPIISVAATPFRLLNPDDMHPWRMTRTSMLLQFPTGSYSASELTKFFEKYDIPRPFNNYLPYGDIDNSAASCEGSIDHVYRFSQEVMEPETVLVSINNSSEIVFSKNNKLNNCLTNWLHTTIQEDGQVVSDKKVTFSIEKWREALKVLKKTCPAGRGTKG